MRAGPPLVLNVLYVEDDPLNRRVVKDMLSLVDARLTEAEDAQAGLCLIDQHDFELVLMDLRMPGMDGLTAIAQIRARPDAKRALPIIVITADAAENIREKCLAGGADDVLTKPVIMKMLFDAIGKVVVGRAQRK